VERVRRRPVPGQGNWPAEGTWRIRIIRAAEGTTFPLAYVENPDGHVPIRAANSLLRRPEASLNCRTSAATTSRSRRTASSRDERMTASITLAYPYGREQVRTSVSS